MTDLIKNFKYFSVFILTFICFNCNEKEDIATEKLNGYWEIKKVTKDDGEVIDFKFNQTVEYFELKNNKGIRKKIYPKLEGKYETDLLADSVFIIQKENKYLLKIKNNLWKTEEEITTLNDSVFIFISDKNIEYQYKRHQKIEL